MRRPSVSMDIAAFAKILIGSAATDAQHSRIDLSMTDVR
jgi:hypothetical protein